MEITKKKLVHQKRRWRIRKNIKGTAERPRLNLRISNKHMYAQCVNDAVGHTVCSLTTLSKEFKTDSKNSSIKMAESLGKAFGEKARAAGITEVVFDRGVRGYHGQVKAFADAARLSLKF